VEFLASLAEAYALSGDRKSALREIARMQEIAKKRYVSGYEFAQVYAALGDKEAAIRDLQRALHEPFTWMVRIGTEPEFSSLHNDPRFQHIIRRVAPTPNSVRAERAH